MAHRVLLVEDEEHLLRTISLNLELEGYDVSAISNGKEALKEFRKAHFDLVILDVMLPEVDGFDICRTIRLENKKVPILFLTAKGSGSDKVKGLKLGADDYLTKPFNLEEFILRVQNLVRRGVPAASKEAVDVYRFGGNEVNFLRFEAVNFKGKKISLSKRETNLLRLLVERKNEVISREEILQAVWGYDVFPSTRTIDNYILAFRKNFEEDPKEPRHFFSVRSVGYKFIP